MQPDPDRSEANLYAYAADNPVTEMDPDGTCFIVCAVANALLDTAIYFATTDSSEWSVQGAAGAAAMGAVTGFLGVGLLSKVAKIGVVARATSKIAAKVPKATRAVKRIVGATRRIDEHAVARARSAATTTKTRAASLVKRIKQIEWRGGEIRFSGDFRIKPHPTPFARDTKGVLRPWQNRMPHYHRRGPGGIDRHRPWDVRPGDRTWRDRF